MCTSEALGKVAITTGISSLGSHVNFRLVSAVHTPILSATIGMNFGKNGTREDDHRGI